MTRKEIYDYIKSHKGTDNLIKQAEGKNYTNCSTAILEKWVTNLKNKEEIAVEPNKADVTPIEVKVAEKTHVVAPDNDSLKRLLEVLVNKRLLLKIEAHYILTGNSAMYN